MLDPTWDNVWDHKRAEHVSQWLYSKDKPTDGVTKLIITESQTQDWLKDSIDSEEDCSTQGRKENSRITNEARICHFLLIIGFL